MTDALVTRIVIEGGRATGVTIRRAGSEQTHSARAIVLSAGARVRGIDALWIADASVMPAVPRGHPNAVVAMIANRGAAWIEEAVS